jgi:hypothetical protein
MCIRDNNSGVSNNARQQKAPAAWMMAPWHCHPFLALLRDGDNGSNANNSAQW